ncbi:Trichodiene oxygenase [Daldinia childiae]|uniref:Trichodiene oxygenase n=1 Tax=Daldinia childiae TaxID=326645 RepID=UPI0014469B27|nr:Trichodiene oxygenase [Daldinia childiae]KAF3062236.1 Trichodiene oxygenase [Daldinia childiae]
MHNKYGPIVRISPNETHCNDVDFIDEIYATSNRKREKPLHFVRGSMFGECAFDTIDHDLHKIRRTVIAKYFTRGMVNQSEKDIHQLTQTLCNKLLISPNDPIDIIEAYNCYTADSICYYLFGEGFGFLNQKGWSLNLHHNIRSVGITRFIFRFFPVFAKLLDLSYHFINYVLPDDIRFLFRTFKVELPNRIQNIRTEIDSGIIRDRPTVFGSLLRLEPEQRKHLNFTDEAALITNAASGTTTWALTVITYHILNKPEILANLTQELNKIVDDPQHLPPLSLLESLPYLAGVIQEGLRLSYGAAGRSPRVPIDEDLIYGEWKKKPVSYVIPRGYAIGMSSFIIHHNDDVFPNSHSFVPERWLDSKSRKILTRHMFAFSRGGRNCLGMNFALCELYMAVAALTLRVFPRMHLFQTTEEDVAYDYDIFSPMPKASSKGVRVVLTAI